MKTTTFNPVVGGLSGSVRKTLTNTFIAVGGMWAITAAASYVASDWKLGLMGSIGLFVASLLCLFAVYAFRNSVVGLGLLGLFSALEGASIGPLLNHYLHMQGGSQLVLSAGGMTAAATFACALYAMTTQRSFKHLHAFLFAGLVAFLVASIIGIFIQATVFHLTLSAIGCLLFTGWLLYDISEVVTGAQDNYIVAAVGIYLDMLNLFLQLLKLLNILGSDD